jgi:hypothetical protein
VLGGGNNEAQLKDENFAMMIAEGGWKMVSAKTKDDPNYEDKFGDTWEALWRNRKQGR